MALQTIRLVLEVQRRPRDFPEKATRYLIVNDDGRVTLPMNLKELYAEAARRGEKLDFVEDIMNPHPTREEINERAGEYVEAIKELINAARQDGIVITIDPIAQMPLAMGNHIPNVEARPAREIYARWMEKGDA